MSDKEQLKQLEREAQGLEKQIDQLRTKRRALARRIEAATLRIQNARTPVPGPKIG